MNFEQLEHVIRAAAEVSGERAFVVVGSQAILGIGEDPPESMLRSIEADIYPPGSPEKMNEVEGALGDGSLFHRTNGYFAHGVGPETSKLPSGWESRAYQFEVEPPIYSKDGLPIAVLCPDPADLVLSKCAAGREKDWDFARVALAHGIVRIEVLLDRVQMLPVSDEIQARVAAGIEGLDK